MRAEFHDRIDTLSALRVPWRALESRALEPNAYLSARVVLPAMKWLPATRRSASRTLLSTTGCPLSSRYAPTPAGRQYGRRGVGN